MSAEEKEELQEKSSPPQDQIVAVIGNADPKKAKFESKSSPRRGWSMAARKDRNCLPCLHSWSRPHLCLRLCFCKSWLLVRFFYWHVTWNLASQDHFLRYINEPWGFQGLIDMISGVLTDLLTQQLQMHRLRYLSFHQVVNSSHKKFFRAHHQNEIFDAQQNIFSSQPQIEICFLYSVFSGQLQYSI